VGEERVNRVDEGGQIQWMYFIFVYENRAMKSVEIVLSTGEGGMENNGGDESYYDIL
jgi:hypothetical protein